MWTGVCYACADYCCATANKLLPHADFPLKGLHKEMWPPGASGPDNAGRRRSRKKVAAAEEPSKHRHVAASELPVPPAAEDSGEPLVQVLVRSWNTDINT